MSGTVLCGVDDSLGGRRTVELGVELSQRFGLRVVMAHVAEVTVRFGSADFQEDDTFWRDRHGAERRLGAILRELGVGPDVERRVAVGDTAVRLAQIAVDESAELIIVGQTPRARFRRRNAESLVDRLRFETPVPVLVAVPLAKSAGRGQAAAMKN